MAGRAARLGEGPRWDPALELLLWVDIEAGELRRHDPRAGELPALEVGERLGAAALTTDGRLLAALERRLVTMDLDGGRPRELTRIPHRRDGMRLNDGACDPAGRFWVGSLSYDKQPGHAALYRLDPGGSLVTVLEEVGLSNGLGWSPDGRLMYYIDTFSGRVDVLDYDLASGAVARRRPFAEIDPRDGIPDGLAVDDEGAVWMALYGGGEVRRYLPDGRLEGRVELPVARVTACAFAGTTLYITTASGREPLAGALFQVDVGLSGPPAPRFAG